MNIEAPQAKKTNEKSLEEQNLTLNEIHLKKISFFSVYSISADQV